MNRDRKQNNFDLLRLLAAIMVIYSHSFALTGFREPATPFYKNTFGGLGVGIFFIISGYLITQSYIKNPNIGNYVKKRFLRIFPALIVVILLSAFVLGPLITTADNYFENKQTYKYIQNVTLYQMIYKLPGVFTENPIPSVNGSLWTLEYEFTFYILIGLLGLLKILDKKKVMFIIWIFFLALNMLSFGKFRIGTIDVFRFIMLGCYFLSGSIFYLYREYITLDKFVFAALILLCIISIRYNGFSNPAFSLILTYIILYIALSKPNLSYLTKYGDYSYGLYIYAFPVQQLLVYLNDGRMSQMQNFLMSTMITFIFAILSWHFIEKPCLKLKNKKLIRSSQRNVAVHH